MDSVTLGDPLRQNKANVRVCNNLQIPSVGG